VIAHHQPALAPAFHDVGPHSFDGGAAVDAVHPPRHRAAFLGAHFIAGEIESVRNAHDQPHEALGPRHVQTRPHQRLVHRRGEIGQQRIDRIEHAHLGDIGGVKHRRAALRRSRVVDVPDACVRKRLRRRGLQFPQQARQRRGAHAMSDHHVVAARQVRLQRRVNRFASDSGDQHGFL